MQPFSKLVLWLFLLLVTAFAVRMAAGVWWQRSLPSDTKFAFADSESYWVLGQCIVRGEVYHYGSSQKARIFRTPGYPVLLAGLFWLLGDDDPHVLWGRAFSAALGTLTVGVVICFAWQLFDQQVGLLAGWLAALYPGAISMSFLVLAEAPFCPLMLAQLVCWTAACRAERLNRSLLWAFAGGMMAAAATLMRPSWLLFTPFAATLAIAVSRQRGRQIVLAACLMVGLITGMTPWWFRNYQLTGKFVPTTLQVGASLYDGLNPQATGASNMQFVARFHEEQMRHDKEADASPRESFEERLDRRMRNAAVCWAQDHPGRVIQLMGTKLLRTWNVWPNASELRSWPLRIVVMVGYAPLLILGLWGCWMFAQRGLPFVLCFLPAVYISLLHMVFVGSIRYRQPPMLPLIVLAAAIVCHEVVPRLRRRQVLTSVDIT